MYRFLLSATAVALTFALQATPAHATPPGKGGSLSLPKVSGMPSMSMSPKIVVSPTSKFVVNPTYGKYFQHYCKSPCGTIFIPGYCFPVGCCPAYSQCCYSTHWRCYIYLLPSCDCWVYYNPTDGCFYQLVYYP